jgi:hypothetical protein
MDAPSARQASSLAWLPAVTATRAPSSRPTCTAMVPMPLEPPCTSNTSPVPNRAIVTTLDHTVHVTSGRAAASMRDTPAGTGSSWPTGTTASSA